MAVFWAFAEVCFRYIGQDPLEMRMMEAAMDSVPRTALAELDSVDSLDWSGVFALALVRIGRHFEMKATAGHSCGCSPNGRGSSSGVAKGSCDRWPL